ncbi:hypothetical protein GCM10007977_015150 [Dactylosporangium sucinum]|uniref:PH domain-containing protein n=1 Tax=Dactylosporangium sucinum TaxID=1424081 RepID=A0A917T934_9ACTN|nr:hypothetical protein GCM10007977_015150 [Dactylosporangium sucinum]
MAYESRMWLSLYRWIRRQGPSGYTYIKPLNAVLWAFIIVSAVETVALHLILPWKIVRIIVDVLSVYGLVWMFGILAGYKVNPHTIDGDGIRLRQGFFVEEFVPWDALSTARVGKRYHSENKMRLVDGQTVSLVVSGQTNVELHTADGGLIRFYADEPDAFAAALERELPLRPPSGS